MKKALIIFLLPFIGFAQSIVTDVNRLFEERKYVQAQRLLLDYVAENPEDIKAIELLGDAYGFLKNWDKAVSCYKELVNSNDLNADFHYKYGGALGMKALTANRIRALGLVGSIKKAFHTSARLDPNHIEARWALVELYMQLPGIIGGSKKKALQYAEELQELSPVDGYLAKGYVYEYDDEPDKAEYNYKRAVEVGGSITCFDKLTAFYENNNMPDQAIANIEKASQKHQRNILHYQLGKVSADYNIQLDKGERCLRTFISNHSSKDGVPVEWAYYRLAQISKHRQNKTEALKWIDKALQQRSDFKQAIQEKQTIQAL
ncbi:MAG: hypothetical protein HKO90_05575 [Flavobacteriaceae bacterium]|nr:hypothetical protein [Bacteroidia bacterium]NNK87731.1 hypothetical protein [Flavobacteriaceae bacterium]